MPGRRRAVAIVDERANRNRARGRVDARVDARDAAGELVARIRAAARLYGEAGLQRREEHLGHGEIQLDDAQIIERRNDRSGIDEAAEADVAQADAAGERRDNDAIVDARLRGCDARFIRQHRRLQLLELRFGQRSGLIQLLAAFVLTAAVVLLRLRIGEIRTRFIAVEFDQHVALAHLLAFAEANRRNPVSDLRRDVHRLVCAHRAQRFDFVRERLLHGRVQPRPRLLADLRRRAAGGRCG